MKSDAEIARLAKRFTAARDRWYWLLDSTSDMDTFNRAECSMERARDALLRACRPDKRKAREARPLKG